VSDQLGFPLNPGGDPEFPHMAPIPQFSAPGTSAKTAILLASACQANYEVASLKIVAKRRVVSSLHLHSTLWFSTQSCPSNPDWVTTMKFIKPAWLTHSGKLIANTIAMAHFTIGRWLDTLKPHQTDFALPCACALGEQKDFEVYSCHVSPDGSRLATAAGGRRSLGSCCEVCADGIIV
jgi:hypothetical protein